MAWIITLALVASLMNVFGLRITPATKSNFERQVGGERKSDHSLTTIENKYGVSFLLYYVQMEGNFKHSESFYMKGISEECDSLTELNKSFTIVGDTSYVQKSEAAKTCGQAAKSSPWKRSFADLAFADETSKIQDMCNMKFGMHLPDGQLRNMSRIWLNKLPLLCEVAETQPNRVTVLLDSGLKARGDAMGENSWNYALDKVSESNFEKETLVMQHYPELFVNSKTGKPQDPKTVHWFGKDYANDGQCVGPEINAMFMAIRGRHCPRIMRAYREALSRVSSKSCKCWDEETVLTDMLQNEDEGLLQAIQVSDKL